MIKTQDLSKRFGEFLAVDSVNLQISAGEVLALLGPNGAGKTTSVRMLSSVLKPTMGQAWVAGFNVVQQPENVRALVGVLTENHGLYNRMPAEDYLEFFGKIYSMNHNEREHRIKYLLDIFGLYSDRNRRIGEFSKGMRQKLALARALLHQPPVLLLDEPTSAMDPKSARLVRDSIQELRSSDRAIVLCTHNLPEAEELADRIAIISEGKIIANGSPSELKRKFLGPPEFEITLATPLNGQMINLPPSVQHTSTGPNWIRFTSEEAKRGNPQVIRVLMDQKLEVVSLQEVPRSLEKVYLQAVHN